MKNEPCPNCGGMLGVPDKLRGLPVECPVCRLEFVPGSSKSSNRKQKNVIRSLKPPKPSLRSVPLPTAISNEVEPGKTEKVKYVGVNSDHLMPPSKPRLSTLTPASMSATSNVESVESVNCPESDPADLVVVDAAAETSTRNQAELEPSSAVADRPAVARIIQTELVHPQLTSDGKLPSLVLADEIKPKAKDGELKSNPVFIGLLICFSLLTSGIMLFVAGMQPSASAKKVLEARENIREFYEVRIDEEVAPYQRDLREAQLANSRGDIRAEIRFYEQVMARFHAEDRNRFQGLTGSPTGDIELEDLVSVLLNEAKRKLKSGR